MGSPLCPSFRGFGGHSVALEGGGGGSAAGEDRAASIAPTGLELAGAGYGCVSWTTSLVVLGEICGLGLGSWR